MPPPIDIPKAPGKLTTRAEYLDVILPAIKAFLAKHGGELICQKDSFLCAARGVSLGIA
jgi:uncharacterized protein (AIM24 family)